MRAKLGGTRSTGCFQQIYTPYFIFFLPIIYPPCLFSNMCDQFLQNPCQQSLHNHQNQHKQFILMAVVSPIEVRSNSSYHHYSAIHTAISSFLSLNLLCFSYFLGTIFTTLNLGAPTFSCSHCRAFFWYEERIRRQRNRSNPTYNLCCKGGRILLPPYQPPPQPLLDLLTSHTTPLSRHFFQHIRQYNSMFAMTSMGAKVINSVNDGHGPYVFKISG
jgi:hypothetical protein